MCKSWNRIGTGRKVILIFPSQRKNNKTVRVLKTPKTDTSERKVYIPGFVAQCLIDIKKEQDEVKEALGSEYTDYNLIMATTFGMPINGSYIRDQMQKVIDKEGLPDVVFHSLRHTSVESIVVFVRCSRSMKFKPVIFPELLKFSHIFSTKYFGDHLNRKKKLFPVVFPMIFHIQPSTKNNCMDMRMKIHGASPCMEDTDIADISPKIFTISSKFTKSI